MALEETDLSPRELVESGLASIEVRQSVHDDYISKVDAEHEQMIWTHPGMSAYYRNSRGKVFSVMPWRLVDYWEMTHDPDMTDYLSNKETRSDDTHRFASQGRD